MGLGFFLMVSFLGATLVSLAFWAFYSPGKPPVDRQALAALTQVLFAGFLLSLVAYADLLGKGLLALAAALVAIHGVVSPRYYGLALVLSIIMIVYFLYLLVYLG